MSILSKRVKTSKSIDGNKNHQDMESSWQGIQNELNQLLQQFPKVISEKPGWTTTVQHKIITDGSRPIRQWPYQIPPAVKREVSEELDWMLKDGLIEGSSSEWSSPIVMVKKKDGSNRICVDYLKLDALMKIDSYLRPQVVKFEIYFNVRPCRCQWQKRIKRRWHSAVLKDCTNSQWCHLVSVEPWPCSKGWWTQNLRGLGNFVGVYLDDVIVYSSEWTRAPQSSTISTGATSTGSHTKIKQVWIWNRWVHLPGTSHRTWWCETRRKQNFGNQANGMPKNKEGCQNHPGSDRILPRVYSKFKYNSKTID